MSAARTLGGGRYVLVEHLADGSTSAVWRATDTRLGVDRAIKVLDRARSSDPAVQERTRREARILARLRHPNIVTIHDVGEEEGRLYLVMDLLSPETLADRIALHGPVPPEVARELLLGVLAALQAVHQEGAVHRDVKPANILTDDKGQAFLLDFGVARVDGTGGLTLQSDRMGEVSYVSPEQRADPRRVDPRADIFSAGALACALLLGEEPAGLIDEQQRGQLIDRLPEDWRPVLDRATQFTPGRRFEAAADMADALQPSVQPEARTSTSSGSGGWLAVSLISGLVGLGLGLWLSPTPIREPPPTPALGELSVSVQPWGMVWLDDQKLGGTPYRGPVEAGTHTLRLVGGDGTTHSQTITVSPSTQTSICWDLTANAPCPR